MTKNAMSTAAKEAWRVKDDFGATGTVVSTDGPEHLRVKWDGEDATARVHHNRAERA